MTDMFIISPAKSTLKRYGMTLTDWCLMLHRQNCVCKVCGKKPKNRRLVIDHEHVKGWRKMKPAERKQYVRMLACNRCNWQFMRRGMTAQIALGMYRALAEYESLKNPFDSQASPV